jgi:hypothetical protein
MRVDMPVMLLALQPASAVYKVFVDCFSHWAAGPVSLCVYTAGRAADTLRAEFPANPCRESAAGWS